MKSFLVTFLIAFPFAFSHSASDNAQALQIVESAIAITQQSDLNFGTASQGDQAKIIAPGTSENAENASFLVTGEANKSYNIILPADGDVNMITDGGGSAEKTIAVNGFQSFPTAGANGMLDMNGQQEIFVGATRDALLFNQQAGSYADTFTVTVLY